MRETRVHGQTAVDRVFELIFCKELIPWKEMWEIRTAVTRGDEVWVFISREEIEESTDLTQEEKAACLILLEKGGWGAAWVRPRKQNRETREPVVGLEPVPGYDTHGNYRGGGGGDSEGSRH